jgi:hypothetical protein
MNFTEKKFAARRLLLGALFFICGSISAGGQTVLSAEQRLEGLLAAMGGREVWAAAKGARVTAVHYTATVRLPFKNVIWNDFANPRHRVESSNEEINGAFVWQKNGESWIKRTGEKPRPMNAQEAESEQRWHESNPYRTLQRLAARDAELTVKLIEPDRLAVFRKDGVRLCWFRLNQSNEPIAFATWEAEDATVFGPLKETASGVRHPKWVARPDGRWRVELIELTLFREKMNFSTAQP